MPLGTPEEYIAAREAETAGVELDHGPHRKHDFHEFLDGICHQAAELTAIADATPGMREGMAKVEGNFRARQNISDIRETVTSLPGRLGMAAVKAGCWATGYNFDEDRWVGDLQNDPGVKALKAFKAVGSALVDGLAGISGFNRKSYEKAHPIDDWTAED